MSATREGPSFSCLVSELCRNAAKKVGIHLYRAQHSCEGACLSPAGSSCTIGVFFDLATTGTRTGTLTVTDNAGDSPQTVSLTGNGQDFSMAPSAAEHRRNRRVPYLLARSI